MWTGQVGCLLLIIRIRNIALERKRNINNGSI
ncbi:unnamed protein product [Nyctereutes procyonoides]|uniref:(raccoon dog) hypothetical protein n=1 Tax=Nyctereutes procyonoides TaxID=34880 RepID=A0A811Z0J0_NYCPR|nr:unnamed protein product [Nyctereutes procyonoides]